MRAQGLRSVTLWLPDTRTEEFRREAYRQSLAISRSEQAKDDQAFVDSVPELLD